MATFEVCEGPPGQGKSLYTAQVVKRLALRNQKWHLAGNPRREIWSNIKFSPEFEDKFRGFIRYWTDTSELVKLRDCDIVWDEIATELDSRNWANLTTELKRFLSQYRKRGIDIYANTQDFSMVDHRARLMISGVRTLTKILGSRDISATKPAPKVIWGLVMIRDVVNYRETEPEKKKFELVPSFMLIEKEKVEIYDTRQDIAVGEPPPLAHVVRYCARHKLVGGDGSCDHCKVLHS